jgi:UDP-N-acetylglucosamine 2-epimerase (non-hydrolysing)
VADMGFGKILVVVGTRPNFIKITQFRKAAAAHAGMDVKIVHTGQHFDEKMADVFFKQFSLIPDFFLNIEGGSPNSQMAAIMVGLEKVCLNYAPDLMIVVGDVNSTFAAALTANKMNIPIAHVESGLRSFDRTMPEEFNRLLTDVVSDIFFITEPSGEKNLLLEGVEKNRIHFVGNTMIDTLVAYRDQIDNSEILKLLGVEKKKYVLMTMHRPATVDSPDGLRKLSELINEVSGKYKIVFPVHPRTRQKAKEFGMLDRFTSNTQLLLTDPLDYFSFQALVKNASLILTDSGGIQEESTFLKVPCLTLRPNTERPVTVTKGTNELVPFDLDVIRKKINDIEQGSYKKGTIPKFWDGKASERIFNILAGKH